MRSAGKMDGTRVLGRSRLHEQIGCLELRCSPLGAGDPRRVAVSRRRCAQPLQPFKSGISYGEARQLFTPIVSLIGIAALRILTRF
jgi:hypothetical protein